jgi:hypothetical protein
MLQGTTSSPRTERLAVTVHRFGQAFDFQLYTRPVGLGPQTVIRYYWMDVSQFRTLASPSGAANYRNCLAHWWRCTQAAGRNRQIDQQVNYVLAQAYPLVCRSKSLQEVYRDAFLGPPRAGQLTPSLADEDRRRIGAIVRSRSRAAVRKELGTVLQRFEPPAEILPALQRAFRAWVGNGVVLWRRDGAEGLKRFLGQVDYWLEKYRKKGGHDRVRHFINLFAYEAKVGFYRCFANAWIDIIAHLRERHGLDPVSERFLRVWHNQNQPIEIPHGQTAAGVLYPTAIQHRFPVAGPRGTVVPRPLRVATERVGATHEPDVFSGQVLSLHPLSGFFMKDPGLCAVAGRLFGSDRYDEILAHGLGEYWDFVGALLIAANQYRRAADDQEYRRGPSRQNREGGPLDAGDADDASHAQLLERFAAAHGVNCADCNAAVRCVGFHTPEVGDRVQVDFVCPNCQKPVPATFPATVLKDWLVPAD